MRAETDAEAVERLLLAIRRELVALRVETRRLLEELERSAGQTTQNGRLGRIGSETGARPRLD